MNELNEAWAIALAEAEARARAAGRKDISEYLALRTSNDLLRHTGSSWLLDMFTVVTGESNRKGASIQTSRDPKHRFKVGNASMVGDRLELANGVRKLVIEVGWPRVPRDGFIRGGGLACANVNHLGMASASEHLRLVLDKTGTPLWITHDRGSETHEIHESHIRHHVLILLSDSRRVLSRR